MADADQPPWEDVDKESSQELIGGDGHDLLLAAVGIVLPAEGDAAMVEGYETMVGDGDAMRIAGQVVQDMLCTTERWLGIDDPLVGIKLSQKLLEALRMAQFMERAKITQISRIKFLIAECGTPSASMLTLMSVEN